jgi:alkanesulfonate monooxygenase SsuD/methylene tetrahydromethanopterin reductase-like flavin-dependent oxidoreductase (luciferase family)
MKMGLFLPAFTEDVHKPLVIAGRARGAGYDAVFSVDHYFPPGAPGRSSLEPFALLSAVAARNPGLGVGVLVTRPGMRAPGLLAKLGAALDHLSGGRAVLGLGVGDDAGRGEHEMVGIPFPPLGERIERLAETSLAIRDVADGRPWRGGRHVPPIEGPLAPSGRPSVWIGGTGERIVAAAAAAADGWNGWGLDAAGFEARARLLAHEVAAAGRDPSEVVPTWGGVVLVAEDRAELERLSERRDAADVPWSSWRGTVDDLRWFRDRLAASGCGWFVCLAAGPDDRPELIARTLRDG